jgi:6-phospho-beta-glucosidase
MRLVIIGGGGFRVPLVYDALRSMSDRLGLDEVTLVDPDPVRLAVMGTVLDQLAAEPGGGPRVRATGDRDDALRGADVVFAAMRVGGLAGRTADERVALRAGLVGQETVGPGGVAFGLRTVPVAVRLAEAVRRLAPGAWTVNFTNPAGLVTEAMSGVLGDRVIGICDSPAGLGGRIARALGVPAERLGLDYVGLNHFGWAYAARVGGVDRLPGLLADDRALASFSEGRLFGPGLLRRLGAIPNEYLHYYHQAGWSDQLAGSDQLADGDQLAGSDQLADREPGGAGPAPGAPDAPVGGPSRGEYLLDQQRRFYAAAQADPAAALALWRGALREREVSYLADARAVTGGDSRDEADVAGGGYERVAVPLVAALAGGDPTRLILNVPNRGAVPGLDSAAVVEVPCLVDSNGARPLAVGTVDPAQLAAMAQLKVVERLVIAAGVSGSRELALRALATHPLVDDPAVAARLLEEYLAALPDLAAALPNP